MEMKAPLKRGGAQFRAVLRFRSAVASPTKPFALSDGGERPERVRGDVDLDQRSSGKQRKGGKHCDHEKRRQSPLMRAAHTLLDAAGESDWRTQV